MKLGFLALAALTASSPLSKRVSGTSTVNLGNNTGTPAHLASGILYGIPDASDQIPDHFYTDFGFNYGRAGGSQISAPGRGWIWGPDEYNVRFCDISYSVMTNFQSNKTTSTDLLGRCDLLRPFQIIRQLASTTPISCGSSVISGEPMDRRILRRLIQVMTETGVVGMNSLHTGFQT